MLARLTATLSAFAVLAGLTGPASGQDPTDKSKPAPVVDVVLCLDVSSSMNELIDSAKVKLWDIVNDLGKVKPTPKLRVGLYSYGHLNYDKARGWVRKEVDLTYDLDTVYQKLNALTIYGGEELVARVCRDALVEQKWSEDKRALKMIFVCGNEAANQDREVSLETVSKMAVGKDVIINTIYCRWNRATDAEIEGYKQLARSAEGRFAQIDMKKGTVAIVTPHDKKLEELSSKLNRTYVAYGREDVRRFKAENQVAQDRNASNAPGAAAGRAATKGGGLYRNSDWDLVDRVIEDPKFDITKVPEAELSDELKKLKPEERVKYVQEKLAERRGIQKEIQDLSTKRAEFIKEEMKKNAKAGDRALDEAVRGALREQAGKKGIAIPD